MQNLVWYNPAYGNHPYNNAYSNNTQYGNGSNSVYSGNSVIYRPGINSYGPATPVQNGGMYQQGGGPANPGFGSIFSSNGVPVMSGTYYYPGNLAPNAAEGKMNLAMPHSATAIPYASQTSNQRGSAVQYVAPPKFTASSHHSRPLQHPANRALISVTEIPYPTPRRPQPLPPQRSETHPRPSPASELPFAGSVMPFGATLSPGAFSMPLPATGSAEPYRQEASPPFVRAAAVPEPANHGAAQVTVGASPNRPPRPTPATVPHQRPAPQTAVRPPPPPPRAAQSATQRPASAPQRRLPVRPLPRARFVGSEAPNRTASRARRGEEVDLVIIAEPLDQPVARSFRTGFNRY
jgi:hypothetical protein